MEELNLIVELLFFDAGKDNFIFPLTNSIRTSFWLADTHETTFSEISFEDTAIDVWKVIQASICIVERDFLKGKLMEGTEFRIGLFPHEIGCGRIITMDRNR